MSTQSGCALLVTWCRAAAEVAYLARWQGPGVALLFLSHLVTQKHTRKGLNSWSPLLPIPFTLSTVNMVISSFTSNLLLPLLPPSVGSYSCVEKGELSLFTVPHDPSRYIFGGVAMQLRTGFRPSLSFAQGPWKRSWEGCGQMEGF